MARQKSVNNTKIEKQINKTAEKVVKKYELPSSRFWDVKEILQKFVQIGWPADIFPLDNTPDLAIALIDPDRYLNLLNTDHPEKLIKRALAFRYLQSRYTPFYTLDQLVVILARFRQYLEDNRESILNMGISPQIFKYSMWFNFNFSSIYNFKHPQIIRFINKDTGDYEDNFYFPVKSEIYKDILKRHKDIYPILHYAMLEHFEEYLIPAGKQKIINQFTKSEVDRIEKSREKIFNLKILILNELENVQHNLDPSKIWPACLNILTKFLTAEEVNFYLYLDQVFQGFNIKNPDFKNEDFHLNTGGLTNILVLIGHFEKELSVKTMHDTRSFLDPFIPITDTNQVDHSWNKSYFNFLQDKNINILDTALDHYLSLQKREEYFWDDYVKRINEVIEKEFLINTTLQIKQKELQVINSLVIFLRDLEKATGNSFNILFNFHEFTSSFPQDSPGKFPEIIINNECIFRATPDFRSIYFQKEKYSVTPKQAEVIQILYEVYINKLSEIGQDRILEEINSSYKRLKDLFKNSDVWKSLITSGKRKGSYCLNIKFPT